MIERITDGDQLIAIYIPISHKESGVNFVTGDDATMQLGILVHNKDKIIPSHIHKPVNRQSTRTQEVLLVRSGRVRADFYGDDERYLESRVMEAGDTLLLISGGHGFEVLDDVDMIEVKTGPYVAAEDKRVFEGKLPEALRFGSK